VRPWHLTRAMPWSRCGDQTRTLLQYLAQSSGALLQPSAGESLPVQESSLWRACHLLIPQAAHLHPPEPSWSSSPWECAASWPPLTLRGLADTLLLELQGVLGSAHRAIVHLFIPSPAFSWLSYELRNSKATSIGPCRQPEALPAVGGQRAPDLEPGCGGLALPRSAHVRATMQIVERYRHKHDESLRHRIEDATRIAIIHEERIGPSRRRFGRPPSWSWLW